MVIFPKMIASQSIRLLVLYTICSENLKMIALMFIETSFAASLKSIFSFTTKKQLYVFLHIINNLHETILYNRTMKTEEQSNLVLLFALGKTTALPSEGTNLAEFLLFQCTFFKKIEKASLISL